MTAAYVRWIGEATRYVSRPIQKLTVPYKLSIAAARPDNRKRDIDNLIKPINDFLKRIDAIEDDCLCDLVTARWVTSGDGVAVRVEPAGVEGA